MSDWTRHGECRPGCGACCTVLVRQMTVRIPAPVQDLAYWDARGFTLAPDGQAIVHGELVAPCPQLATDQRCRLHLAGKPQYCQDYPQRPEDIAGLPCSYWFTRDGEAWGGTESPYPVRGEVTRG